MTLKSIKENAIINIQSRQTAHGVSETVDFTTTGSFYMRGVKYYVFYNEREEMGMADCRVMLIADADTVSMRRSGAFELKLFYRAGESESVIYYMPFGEVNMTQTTHRVECNMSDAGGVIKVRYTLCMGVEEQLNELTIRVGRQKE